MTRFNALLHEAVSSGPDADCFTVQCGLMINLVYTFRQYGKDYIAVEDAAHQAHKGMWQGSFEMPADWRKDQKIDKLLAQRGRSLQPQGEVPSRFNAGYYSIHLVQSWCCNANKPLSAVMCTCYDKYDSCDMRV